MMLQWIKKHLLVSGLLAIYPLITGIVAAWTLSTHSERTATERYDYLCAKIEELEKSIAKDEPLGTVLIAKERIAPDRIIGKPENFFETKPMRLADIPEWAIRDPAALPHRQVTKEILKDSVLTLEAIDMNPGTRAVRIRTRFKRGEFGAIPNEFAKVVRKLRNEGDFEIVVKKALVKRVDLDPIRPETSENWAWVTLKVTPSEAEILNDWKGTDLLLYASGKPFPPAPPKCAILPDVKSGAARYQRGTIKFSGAGCGVIPPGDTIAKFRV